nr:thioredoxin domain-containing protein [Candidatus Nitrosopelagicus sp.]
LIVIGIVESSSFSSVLYIVNILDGSTILVNLYVQLTIFVYRDYQLSFCYKFHNETMPKINEKYLSNENVNFIYKDFPLNGKSSLMASEASYCAQKQDQFWEYHDKLYENWGGENTGWITQDALSLFAREVGLELDDFNACMAQSEFRQKVLDNEQFAREININATPTFLIFNDDEVYRIIGSQSIDKFEQVIQKLGNS